MKTIKLFDQEMPIEREYEMAVCIWETSGSRMDDFEDESIKFGQKVYNVKILETGSIIFTNSPESQIYIVTIFSQFFGFPSEDQLIEIKKLEDSIRESQDRINKIYGSIERSGYTHIE